MSYPKNLRLSVAEKIQAYSRAETITGCWLWEGVTGKNGYGKVRDGRKTILAHRASYELVKGPIPEGFDIDHLCRVRCCVNPDHLEAVTRKENLLRGVSFSAINSVKEYCKRGHPLSGENLRIRGSRRVCRACTRLACNRYDKYRRRRNSAATQL